MRPDVVVILTDEERAAPPYEADDLRRWRHDTLTGRRWFAEHGVTFGRHYTGSLACVPSRPTLFTGQYPDVHGVTQTDGLGKDGRRLPACAGCRPGEVPTLGHWFRAGGYDTHYDGKWHISHADLIDPATGRAAGHQRRRRRRRPGGGRRPTSTPTRSTRSASRAGSGPSRTAPALANSGAAPRPADRRPGRGLARGPLRPPPGRRRRRAAAVPARGQLRQPARHRAVPGVGPATSPIGAVAARPARRCRRAPTADEDLAHQARGPDRLPGRLPVGLRPAAGHRPHLRAQRAASTATSTTGCTPRSTGRSTAVRRAVTEGGSDDAVLVRTADHGELLGAHGGLHQKWFNLYDEATRVPFTIARVGDRPTTAAHGRRHADLARRPRPDAAGRRRASTPAAVADELRRDVQRGPPAARAATCMPVVDGPRRARPRTGPSTCMTRDNMLEGDTGASGLARRLGRTDHPPAPLRIQVPAHVGANFEGDRRPRGRAATSGSWCAPSTTRPPGPSPGCATSRPTGPAAIAYRTEPLARPVGAVRPHRRPDRGRQPGRRRRARPTCSPTSGAGSKERAGRIAVPERHQPVALRRPRPRRPGRSGHRRPPARLLRRVVQRLGHAPRGRRRRRPFDLHRPAGAGRRAPTTACSTSASRPACSPAR